MARPRKRPGRPAILQDPKRVSVMLGRKESRLLASHQRVVLEVQDTVSRSELVRSLVRRGAADKESLEVTRLEARHAAELAELQRRLERADVEKAQLRAAAERARQEKGTVDRKLERLQRQLPIARALAADNSRRSSGDKVLDQIWQNAGFSWRRVVARLERELVDHKPPDPGGERG